MIKHSLFGTRNGYRAACQIAYSIIVLHDYLRRCFIESGCGDVCEQELWYRATQEITTLFSDTLLEGLFNERGRKHHVS